jgi:hypothetical protein
MQKLLNWILFYGVWLAAVKGAAIGLLWLGPLVMFAAFVLHIYQSSSKRSDLILGSICLLLGAIFESLISGVGVVHFAGYTPESILAPAWVLALWVNISITINHSLSFLKERLWLASLLGAISGPLSYLGGLGMGAASAEDVSVFIIVYAVIWAIVIPIIFFVARLITRPYFF